MYVKINGWDGVVAALLLGGTAVWYAVPWIVVRVRLLLDFWRG